MPVDETPPIQFGGFIAPERVIGDYAAAASFLVTGQTLIVTVSVTLAALVEGRAGHPIDWLDYPPLAALGYERIADLLDRGLSASEIPLTAEDAEPLLSLDRLWWKQTHGSSPPATTAT
ncbi:MAG: hypothetical protein ACR2JW_10030 [Thermomicrobiales bacterium]